MEPELPKVPTHLRPALSSLASQIFGKAYSVFIPTLCTAFKCHKAKLAPVLKGGESLSPQSNGEAAV